MANEVETILNEIRERVRAEEQQRQPVIPAAQNGNQARDSTAMTSTAASEALARLDAHLTTTARAWDRLPPVFSNRKGTAARFELWLKARMKSLTRWFTWEQTNFNSAVHHALSDISEALRAHEQRVLAMQAEVEQVREALRVELERTKTQMRAESAQVADDLRAESRQKTEALVTEVAHSLRTEVKQKTETLRTELANTREALRSERSQTSEEIVREVRQTAASLRNDLSQTNEDLRSTIDARAAEVQMRLTQLADDLHEEQRVCFKQLSLETSEAAMLEDRGRRAVEARLEKLEQASAQAERKR
jgi:hypothetical protein